MTARLTRGRIASYRSHVGAESVPMGIWKSSPLTAPEPRRVSFRARFCFLWSGERISPRGLAGTPCVGSFQNPFRPATKGSGSAPVVGGSTDLHGASRCSNGVLTAVRSPKGVRHDRRLSRIRRTATLGGLAK